MSDPVSILQARNGCRMAKTLRADGTFRDYDSAYTFDASAEYVQGLDDIRELLQQLMCLSDTCVVRGKLIHGDSARGIRRLVYPDQKTGDQPTLRDVPHHWLALDVDDVARPSNVRPENLLDCADVVIEQLPRPFMQAGAIVQASAGHGIKPGIRLRLWYWCDRPVTGAELKRWLATAPVDTSVFNAAQPIYTAAPVMAAGVIDHLPYRLTEWPGDPWLKVPSEQDLAPPPKLVPEITRPAWVSGSARAKLYAEAAMTKAHARISGASQRHPAILSEACGLARLVHAGMISTRDLHDTLWHAAQVAGKEDEAEIGRMVAFGLDHPDATPLPMGLQHG